MTALMGAHVSMGIFKGELAPKTQGDFPESAFVRAGLVWEGGSTPSQQFRVQPQDRVVASHHDLRIGRQF